MGKISFITVKDIIYNVHSFNQLGNVCLYYQPHRKDDGRLCFHRCLYVHTWGGGVPHSQVWMAGGVSHSWVWMGGTLFPGLDREVPLLDWRGVPPSQVLVGRG